MRTFFIFLFLLSIQAQAQDDIPVQSRFENGVVATRGAISNGQRTGKWKFYQNDGSLWVQALYSDGILHSYKEQAGSDVEDIMVRELEANHGQLVDHKHWQKQAYLQKMLRSDAIHPFAEPITWVVRFEYRTKQQKQLAVEHLVSGSEVDLEALKKEHAGYLKSRKGNWSLLRADLFLNGTPYSMLHLPTWKGIEAQQPLYDGNGWWYSTWQNRLFSRIEIQNGMPNGAAIWYHENGEVAVRGNFNRARRHGEWEGYYPNGDILWRHQYQNDTIRGEFLVFYPEKKLYLEAQIQQAFAPSKESHALLGGLHFGALQLKGVLSLYDEDGKRFFSTDFPYPIAFGSRAQSGIPEAVFSHPVAVLPVDNKRLQRWLYYEPLPAY